jgi:hypothetical protein
MRLSAVRGAAFRSARIRAAARAADAPSGLCAATRLCPAAEAGGKVLLALRHEGVADGRVLHAVRREAAGPAGLKIYLGAGP